MMMYVIIKKETGEFVALPGLEKSYTAKAEDAQTFFDRTSAEQHCCKDSEHVVSVENLFKKPR